MIGFPNFQMMGMQQNFGAMPMMNAGVSMGASVNIGGLSLGMGVGMDAVSMSPSAMMMSASPFGGGYQLPMMGMSAGMGMVPGMSSMQGMQQMQMMQMMQMMMQMMMMMESSGMGAMMMGGGGGGLGYPLSMSMPGMGMAGLGGMNAMGGGFGSPLGMMPPWGMNMGGMQGGFQNINANPALQIPNFGNNANKAQIGQMLDVAAQKYGIPPNILKGVAWQESGWRSNASSFDGGHGKGVMQIDDRFHKFANTNAVWDPAQNIEYGAKYLHDLYEKTGSWEGALKRYNGGSDYPPRILAHAQNQPWQKYA
ncbi:MAG: lytic transglycosylase domain-containing protein [Firmicutes bacterium]|nr:lytic transglycosylase domain-containing protein [Bacillota bacterium]